MKNKCTYLYLITFSLALACVIQMLYFYHTMPELMASKFDLQGKPIAAMGKNLFFFTYVFLVLLFAAACTIVPWVLSKSDRPLYNIPNREYWLAPERRIETATYIGNFLLKVVASTYALLLIIMQNVFAANQTSGMQISTPILLLGISIEFGLLLYWSIQYYRKFRVTGQLSPKI